MSESVSDQGNKRQIRTTEAQTAQAGASASKKARLVSGFFFFLSL